MKSIFRKALLFATAAFGLFILGCEKDDPIIAETKSIDQFFAENRKASEFFTVNSAAATTIMGSDGTKITFPANSFQTASGTPVAGNVQVELIEIFDKSDMILSNRPTVSDGQILISAGELYVQATQGGSELKLANSKFIKVETPTDKINYNMGLFTGADSAGQFTWTPVVADTSFGDTTIRTSPWFNFVPSFPSKYVYGINQLGWINCDYFYYNPNIKTTVTVDFTNKPSNEIAVYYVFNDINSVMRAYASVGKFSQSNIPVGSDITLVAVSINEGKLYLAQKSITVTANQNETLTFAEVTEAQLESELKSFD